MIRTSHSPGPARRRPFALSRRGLIAGLAPLLAGAADAAPVQVYAAMTFRPALDAVLRSYRAAGGAAVAVYGPTPVLVRQLDGGAPADILLTADPAWMDDAARRALIRADTRATLLTTDLVLAGPAGHPSAGTITRGFAIGDLLGAGRLAMCDPDHDPAGRYAKQSLQALGLWPAVAAHIAIAESSPAAVTMVDRGEVPAAVCFATDLHGDSRATIIGQFPADSHAPIVYPVALTRTTHNPQAAGALAFLRSPAALSIFSRFGYRAPNG